MDQNLSFYVDEIESNKVVIGLVTFGITIIARAKIIQNANMLSEISSLEDIQNRPAILEMFFEKLTDDIRIMIFFENYFKAVLISKNFCVHIPKKMN